MNDDAEARTVYRISFLNQGEVYEIFARSVGQGPLFGFVEVGEILFGERTQLLIDSSEERLKTEFDGVKRTHIPLHAILRIDEVDRPGGGRIRSGNGTVSAFPTPLIPPARPPGRKK